MFIYLFQISKNSLLFSIEYEKSVISHWNINYWILNLVETDEGNENLPNSPERQNDIDTSENMNLYVNEDSLGNDSLINNCKCPVNYCRGLCINLLSY